MHECMYPSNPTPLLCRVQRPSGCVTNDGFRPNSLARVIPFNSPCDNNWAEARLRELTTDLGCTVAGTLCTAGQRICAKACQSLYDIARQRCLDPNGIVRKLLLPARMFNVVINAFASSASAGCCRAGQGTTLLVAL